MKDFLKSAFTIAMFLIGIWIFVWYVKGHFGKKWYWFWIFTIYFIIAGSIEKGVL